MTDVQVCLLGACSSCYCWHVRPDIRDPIRTGSSQNVATTLQFIISPLSSKRFILDRVAVDAWGGNEAVDSSLKVWWRALGLEMSHILKEQQCAWFCFTTSFLSTLIGCADQLLHFTEASAHPERDARSSVSITMLLLCDYFITVSMYVTLTINCFTNRYRSESRYCRSHL